MRSAEWVPALIILAKRHAITYLCGIEFRPNDLALPRKARLSNDILPISKINRAAFIAQAISTCLEKGTFYE
jgi:hypothetical protein